MIIVRILYLIKTLQRSQFKLILKTDKNDDNQAISDDLNTFIVVMFQIDLKIESSFRRIHFQDEFSHF